MAVPTPGIQTEVNYFVKLESEFRGVSPDSLTTTDLQALAYGVRLAASETGDAERSQQLFKTADAIDGLSDLTTSDLDYLEKLA